MRGARYEVLVVSLLNGAFQFSLMSHDFVLLLMQCKNIAVALNKLQVINVTFVQTFVVVFFLFTKIKMY